MVSIAQLGQCVSVWQHRRRPPAFDSNMQQLEVFIGNLDPNVTEEELRQIFLQFGEIIYVKIPTSRGCGFVQFTARASAEEAIQRIQGTMIGQQAVHTFLGAGAQQLNRTYLVSVVSKQIQVNGAAPIMVTDKVMMPMVMGLRMILHYMHMVHTLVARSTLNRLKVLKKWPPCQVLSRLWNKGRNMILWLHQMLTS